MPKSNSQWGNIAHRPTINKIPVPVATAALAPNYVAQYLACCISYYGSRVPTGRLRHSCCAKALPRLFPSLLSKLREKSGGIEFIYRCAWSRALRR